MKKEVKIGIFAITMICCAWAGTKFFSGIDIFSRNVEYKAVYEQISGIQTASSIMINGVKVGTVTNIEFDPSVDKNVYIQLTIQRKYKIPVDSQAKIANNGIMSSKIINITLGESTKFLDAGEYIQVVEDVDLLASASSDFEVFKIKLDDLNNEVTRTLSNINILLEGNNKNITTMFENLSEVSTNLNALLDSRKGDLGRIIGGFAEFSESLGENSERIDSIMMNLASISGQLNDANVGEALGATISELNNTLAALNSTEGSIGKLMNDEQLYNNLVSTAANLDSLFIDFKENPDRYIHVSVFGKKTKVSK